ncbi:maltose excess protein 1-like, chloroplastic [Tasmannia lanceolata]|uniref:maltose excess protein 1-like, chloroplastic n=1 Tax=Tasmannia lanceolata TaxID=3420 RepID=UPI004063426C
MQATKNQSWRISVHARAKSFEFKFRAGKFFPSLGVKATHFTFLLKLRRFFLKMETDSGVPVRNCRRWCSISRILHIIKKPFIRIKAPTNKGRSNLWPENDFVAKRHGGFLSEEPLPAITGNLALLSGSVSQKDHEGITIYAFTLIFYLVLLVKSFLSRTSHFPLLLVASMASSIGFSLNYLNYRGHIPEVVWKAWNHTISFGCLYLLTQVILSRFYFHIERKKSVGFLISAMLPFYLKMMDLGVLSNGGKNATEASSTWIANLLLVCQSFSNMLVDPGDPKKLVSFFSSAHFLVKEIAKRLAPYLFT